MCIMCICPSAKKEDCKIIIVALYYNHCIYSVVYQYVTIRCWVPLNVLVCVQLIVYVYKVYDYIICTYIEYYISLLIACIHLHNRVCIQIT